MGATNIPTVPGGRDAGKVPAGGGAATQRLTQKCYSESQRHPNGGDAEYSPNGPAPKDRGNRTDA